MADFVQTTVNRTALRDLTVPIADVTSFNTLVESIFDDNPFGCVGYTTKAGETVPPIIKNREHYTAKVNFVNGAGKKVGTVSLQSPTWAFEANASEVLATPPSQPRCSGSTKFCRSKAKPQVRLAWAG